MAKQSDVLQPYNPMNFPADQRSQERYLPEQDQRIANCLNQLIQVVKKLDARMVAAGL